MKKKMNKVFMVCLAATAMTAGMSVSAFAVNVKSKCEKSQKYFIRPR